MNTARQSMLRTILVATVVCLGFSGAARSEPESRREVQLFEQGTRTLLRVNATVVGEQVYVPMLVVVGHLGLVRKMLPGGSVGLCRDDLCVPLSAGDGPLVIRLDRDRELVPMRYLAEAFGGTSVWHSETNDLLLDLVPKRAPMMTAPQKPFDLTLPDLSGKDIALSAFRGKKVLLFAWASW